MNRFESQHTEWKESWRDDLLRWVCGFANAEGGRLEIGRNDKAPTVANAFFRAGEIETWGRGIQRIFRACQDAGTPAPIIDYKPNDLWIEFPFSLEYLKAIAATSQSNAQAGAQSGVESGAESPMTSQILGFLAGESLSKAQIARKLRKAKPNRYLNDLMAKLIQADQVEFTLPDKPNSRLQKYRLTENGRAWLSQNQP